MQTKIKKSQHLYPPVNEPRSIPGQKSPLVVRHIYMESPLCAGTEQLMPSNDRVDCNFSF